MTEITAFEYSIGGYWLKAFHAENNGKRKHEYNIKLLDPEGKSVSPPLEVKGRFWRNPTLMSKVINHLFQGQLKKQVLPEGVLIEELPSIIAKQIEDDYLYQSDDSDDNDNRESSDVSDDEKLSQIRKLILLSDSVKIYHRAAQNIVISSLPSQVSQSRAALYYGVTFQEGLGSSSFIVGSDKRIIRFDRESLLNNDLLFTSYPTTFNFNGVRWTGESVNRWISGQTYLDVENQMLLDKITTIYNQYLEFADGDVVAKLLACWTIGTYFHVVFTCYPYIYLNGIKASGKTKVLDVTSLLAFNALLATGISPQSTFRIIQTFQTTLLLDEGESLNDKERSEGIRELLLSGSRRGASTVRLKETTNDDGTKTYTPEQFHLYSPKMIANITGLEETLESRCISITMKPAINFSKGSMHPNPDDPMFRSLRNHLYHFALKHWSEIGDIYERLENDGSIMNREWDNWRPMFAIAKFFGEDIYDQIHNFARRKITELRKSEEDSTSATLIKAIYANFAGDAFYTLASLRDWFAVYEGFDVTKLPRWLTNRYMGSLMKTMGFREKRHGRAGQEIMIRREHLTEQMRRMKINIEELESKAPAASPQLDANDPMILQLLDRQLSTDGSVEYGKFVQLLLSNGFNDPEYLIEKMLKRGLMTEIPAGFLRRGG